MGDGTVAVHTRRGFLHTLLMLTALVTLACCAWFAAEAAMAARAIAHAVRTADRVAADLPLIIDRRAAEIVARIDERAGSLERTAAARFASLERTADARLASAEARLDARLGEAIATADRRLGEATGSVARLVSQASGPLASAERLLQRTDGAVADLHRSVFPWIDCGSGVVGEGKPCLQYELWWMTRKANLTMSSVTLAAETTSETLRRYGPSTAKSVDGIAASLDRMGRWYTSKRRLFVEGGLTLAGAALRGGL